MYNQSVPNHDPFDAFMPLLLCGIPASGKSTYGRWMERAHRVLFVDMEQQGELERAGLLDSWERLLDDPATAQDFVRTLAEREQGVVIAWGFPVDYLPLLFDLKAAGMAICWFDGDRDAARESFIRRGTVPLKYFDRQMSEIQKNWPQIANLTGGRIIASVQPGPSYLPCTEIYTRMFRLGFSPGGLM